MSDNPVAETGCRYAGANWLVGNLALATISPLGSAVADVLGNVYQGLYHLKARSLRKVEWTNAAWIEIIIGGSLATYDSDLLTRLVVLCHDRLLRLEISGIAPGYLRLRFSQRAERTGEFWQRHPTLEQAAATVRDFYAAPYQEGP